MSPRSWRISHCTILRCYREERHNDLDRTHCDERMHTVVLNECLMTKKYIDANWPDSEIVIRGATQRSVITHIRNSSQQPAAASAKRRSPIAGPLAGRTAPKASCDGHPYARSRSRARALLKHAQHTRIQLSTQAAQSQHVREMRIGM